MDFMALPGSRNYQKVPVSHHHQRFLNFDHRILQKMRDEGLENRRLLLAVSGGADSVALLLALSRLCRILNLSLSVANIHHGEGLPEQEAFRDRAFCFVKELCFKMKLPFYSNAELREQAVVLTKAPKKILSSEAEMREFRYKCLNAFLVLESPENSEGLERESLLVTGHNANDLLETQLIQCIRGVGLGGLAQIGGGDKCHPLEGFTRKEIEDYLGHLGQDFLTDPSNVEVLPLRNWLRQVWLPQLEEKRTSSLKSLSKSFQMLTRGSSSGLERKKNKNKNGEQSKNRAKKRFSSQVFSQTTGNACFALRILEEQSYEQQSEILVTHIKALGITNYKKFHVDEFLKKIDHCAKKRMPLFHFRMLSKNWRIEDGFLWQES